jgi:hypothetical protein
MVVLTLLDRPSVSRVSRSRSTLVGIEVTPSAADNAKLGLLTLMIEEGGWATEQSPSLLIDIIGDVVLFHLSFDKFDHTSR